MNGVTLGEKHSYNDFGLILSKKVIEPPEPQTKLVSVPLRDGSLDLTEAVTDDVKYKDRYITLTFSVIDAMNMWSAKVSAIENYLHGKRLRIVFDDDAAFYYVGRLAVNSWKSSKAIGTLVIEGVCEPYKYDVQSSAEDWLWDIFDFETGYIHEAKEIHVVKGTEIIIIGKRKRTYPIITASMDMLVSYKGMHSIKAGVNKMYNIILDEGENVLTFFSDGSAPLDGTVTVEYTGGSL